MCGKVIIEGRARVIGIETDYYSGELTFSMVMLDARRRGHFSYKGKLHYRVTIEEIIPP